MDIPQNNFALGTLLCTAAALDALRRNGAHIERIYTRHAQSERRDLPILSDHPLKDGSKLSVVTDHGDSGLTTTIFLWTTTTEGDYREKR